MPKLLEVKDLKTCYATRKGPLRAVDGVSLDLDYGEALGLVGESGCGKTTAALSVCRLLPREGRVAGGQILVEGVDYAAIPNDELLRHRWKDVSIIFQGAMNALNPVKRVGDQIAEAVVLHEGLSGKEALQKAGDLLELVEIPRDRARRYPHEFSGGMKQRAMIAMALSCGPKLVIGDEPTTALDVMVQAQILNLLERLRRELGMGMLLITHDLSILGETCDRIAVMYAGRVVESGTVADIFQNARHPYTRKLITCFPDIGGKTRQIPEGIDGFPPDLVNPPGGCCFSPRCEFCLEKCGTARPPELFLGGRHTVACHLCAEGKGAAGP